jgi:cysteine desulfuration protein SufE
MNRPDIKDILDDFEYLEDWDDRYKYLIELGDGLAPLAEREKNATAKVRGCVSQVWIVTEHGPGPDPVLTFRGDSDAHIVRGLIAVVLAIFSGKTASEITGTNETEIMGKLRLSENITPQRSNGLRSMINRNKQEARQVIAA